MLSLALLPDDMSLLPVVGLSVLRAAALIVGLLCFVLTGRLDRWSSSRLWLTLLAIGGAVVVTFVCASWQLVRQDMLPPPYSVLYVVLARALPIGLMAAVFLPTKKPFLSVVGCAIVMGIVFAGTLQPLSQAYAERKAAAQQARNEADATAAEARLQRQLAELAQVPADAGPEPLLPFLDPPWSEGVQQRAVARLNDMPDVAERLARLLDGERRLAALRALNLRSGSSFAVSDAIRQRSWITAAAIARSMGTRMQTGEVPYDEVWKFCRAFAVLSNDRSAAQAILPGHRDDLLALRDWLRSPAVLRVNWCGEPDAMDRILRTP